jgi:hypothetical protein
LGKGDIAAERNASDLVDNSVDFTLPQGRPEPDGEDVYDQTAPAGHKKVTEFVDKDGQAKKQSDNGDGENGG